MGSPRKAQPVPKSKKGPKPATIQLPPSKLTICQYGFAFVTLRRKVSRLKVTGNSNRTVVPRARALPSDTVVVIIAGKNFGTSIITISGMFSTPKGNVPFVQKITVSIVLCPQKKPAPPPPPVPGPPVIGPVIPKSVFEGKTYYVTLHISLDGSKVALINVKLANSNSTVASASYDPASQTVSGVGLEDGTATITVTGSAQGASLNVPFSQDIKVTVTDRPGAEEDEP